MSDFNIKKPHFFDLIVGQLKKRKKNTTKQDRFVTQKPLHLLLPPSGAASCSSSRRPSGLDRICFAQESPQLDGNCPQQPPGEALSSCPGRLPRKPQINTGEARLQCCPLLYIQSN